MNALERRLRRSHTPEPPPGLREQVLRAAGEAAQRRVDSANTLDRLWELRELLVTALVLLAVAHVAVSSVSARWEQEWGWTRPAPRHVASWNLPVGGGEW
jgi:hypothetical protein